MRSHLAFETARTGIGGNAEFLACAFPGTHGARLISWQEPADVVRLCRNLMQLGNFIGARIDRKMQINFARRLAESIQQFSVCSTRALFMGLNQLFNGRVEELSTEAFRAGKVADLTTGLELSACFAAPCF